MFSGAGETAGALDDEKLVLEAGGDFNDDGGDLA